MNIARHLGIVVRTGFFYQKPINRTAEEESLIVQEIRREVEEEIFEDEAQPFIDTFAELFVAALNESGVLDEP